MRSFLHLLLAASLAMAISACMGVVDIEGDVLRVGNGTEPQDIDPHITTGIPEHQIELSLFQGLVVLNPETLEPEPGAAESWEISEDGLTYIFTLRPDGRWSNGDPVTAHDFVYSWQRILTPSLGSAYSYMLHCIKNAQRFNEGEITDFSEVGVKAADDHTLVVTLESPTAYFLSMQIHNTYFPVHKPTIEAFGGMGERGTKWTRAGNLVGNGPFRLVTWWPDYIIQVVRNEHYWDAENVPLDGIEFYPVDHMQTEELLFRSGNLDITETIPLHKIAGYKEEHPDLVHLDPWLGIYFYRFNVTRPPFDDVRVRKAFHLAFDRETLAAQVLKGAEPPAFNFVPPMPGYPAEPAAYPFDPEAARALLAEAGYPEGRGFPEVEILYNTAEQHKTIAEAIQAMWKEQLNVEVGLVNQDWKVYLDTEKQLDYWISRAAWIADYMDPINFLDMFITGSGNNRTGFSNAEYDALIEEINAETDTERRTALMLRAERILLESAAIMPIYFYTTKYLKAPEVENMPSNVMRYRRWDRISLAGGGTGAG